MFDPERTGRFIRFLAYAQKEIARMNAPLPPFNLVSRCPKCGLEGGGPDRQFDGVRLVLHAPDPFPIEYHAPYPISDCSTGPKGEHLHRTCPRCEFEWAEACSPAESSLPVDAVPVFGSPVRRKVAAFALLMEGELRKHDDRPGWKELNRQYLLERLLEEADEVRRCLWGPSDIVGPEVADVANFAMMIADVAGALDPEKGDVS